MNIKHKCNWNHPDCFALAVRSGDCQVLKDTNFHSRNKCPFFKSKEQYENENALYREKRTEKTAW